MSEVGKTPKLAVATPKVTAPQGSTSTSDRKPAQPTLILKVDKGKEKVVKQGKGKDSDRDILIGGVPKF